MILIAGAGISGLSLAWFLKEKGIDFLIIDPDQHPGGKIRTIHKDGFQMDTGPNTILADSQILQFLNQLGLEHEIAFPSALSNKRFIFRNGKFHGISPNPFQLLFSRLITWKGKWRIWQERNILPEKIPAETFGGFVRRRFGQEALDWLGCPIQYGIHAADPEELLIEDAFPKIIEMEMKFGSVLRGIGKGKIAERPKTLSFKGGMQTLPNRLAEKIGSNLILNTTLLSIKSTHAGWHCVLEENGKQRTISCSEIVFCMPATEAANIVMRSGMDAMAAQLSKIRYNSMTVSHLVFNQAKTEEFRGFGGIVPPAAGFQSAGAIWTSSLFAGRAPAKQHLITSFAGGALQKEFCLKSPDTIREILQTENPMLYGRKAAKIPDVSIWKEAIPSYSIERKSAEEAIESMKPDGLHFLANWKGGIGLADCIRNASTLSQQFKPA